MTEQDKTKILNNLEIIRKNANEALKKSPYNQKVNILAATKTRTPEEINFAIECGIEYIGENRVQELLEKYDYINKNNVHIHFIGKLQKNKVKYIIDKVELIHSVDNFPLALEIDKRAKAINKVMDVLIEINIGNEESKSGVSLENAENFIKSLYQLNNIRVRGVMIIPPKMTDPVKQKLFFEKIMDFYIDILQKKLHNKMCSIISMGMSQDYPIAIESGSNLIRVGTCLFGERNY